MDRMRRAIGIGGLCGLLGLAAQAGCGPAPGSPRRLAVAAASDLQVALPEVVDAYRQATGVEVEASFGATGQLASQIRQGSPVDLLLAANRSYVDDLARSGEIRPDSVRPYAVGSLVLAVRAESTGLVRSLADLARPEVARVAIANPEVAPYGAAARQALRRAGLWGAVEPKLAVAGSVRLALEAVRGGNADAGLVGRSLVAADAVAVVEVDPKLYDPIVQGLGVVASTPRGDEARQFSDFRLGDEGQAILARHGFGPPPR